MSNRSTIVNGLFRIFLALLIIYFVICVALFHFQRSFLYFPQPGNPSDRTPTIAIKTEVGDVLVATHLHEGDKAIVYFGGNGDNVSDTLPVLTKAFPDCSLYLLNYRGYAGSAGSPTEAAIVSDAERLVELVQKDHRSIVLIGRSLGSGVAVHLASERLNGSKGSAGPIKGLILVTPYYSIEQLASDMFRLFPISLILEDKFQSWKYAPIVSVPTLIIKAGDDEVIPGRSTDQLFGVFHKGVAEMKVINGAGHNSIFSFPEYVEDLRRFESRTIGDSVTE
jgi:pimeloyl-ACP methyl ester carboxylesterase